MARKTDPTLSDALRDAARTDGRTPYAIAKAAGIAAPMLTRFLNEERDLRLASAEKLAEALGYELRKKE